MTAASSQIKHPAEDTTKYPSLHFWDFTQR